VGSSSWASAVAFCHLDQVRRRRARQVVMRPHSMSTSSSYAKIILDKGRGVLIMKTCPFCYETDLQDAAKVCKHCGRNITQAEKPFYEKNFGYKLLIVLTGCAGFFFFPIWILTLVFLLLDIRANK
jgi:hypothetical protein